MTFLLEYPFWDIFPRFAPSSNVHQRRVVFVVKDYSDAQIFYIFIYLLYGIVQLCDCSTLVVHAERTNQLTVC